MLNTIVCIKSVPGYITSAKISDGGDNVVPAIGSLCMNESDEYALEEALVLRTRNGGEVTAITAGPPSFEDILFTSVAKGADRAVRVNIAQADVEVTSKLLALAISRFNFNLVLTGLESSDNLAAQVGVSVAERLKIPFLFGVNRVEIASGHNSATVTKELGGGDQAVLEVSLPALLSVQTGIQPVSYAPYAKVFQARRKGINTMSVKDLGISEVDLQRNKEWRFLEVLKPTRERKAQMIGGNPKEIAQKILPIIREHYR